MPRQFERVKTSPSTTARNHAEEAAGNLAIYVPTRELMALVELRFPELAGNAVIYPDGDGNIYPTPEQGEQVAAFMDQLRGARDVAEQVAAGGWHRWRRKRKTVGD